MLITKECDYGIRIIRALATGTKKTARAISTEELIPHKFACKIIKKLEHAEYVKSTLGSNGGYRLIRPLNTLTLADIITAIDTNRCISKCLSDDSDCVFKGQQKKQCNVHRELMRTQDIVMEALSSKTMDAVLYGDAPISSLNTG